MAIGLDKTWTNWIIQYTETSRYRATDKHIPDIMLTERITFVAD